jgi:zinc protease
VAPRLAPPLSYAPLPPAPDEAFRASPPPEAPLDTSPSFDLKTAHLENGMQILLVERHSLPVFAARLVIQRGARDLSHQRPELLDLAADSVVRAHASSPGARPDLRPAAECGADDCELRVSGLSRSFDAALATLADLAMRPQFPASDLAIVQRTWKSWMDRMGGTSEDAAGNNELSLLFPPGDAYAPVSDLERRVIAAATMRELSDAYSQVFQPQHATLVVAGDTGLPELLASARRAFGGWAQSRPALTMSAAVPPSPAAQSRAVLVDSHASLVHAYLVARGPLPGDSSLDAMTLLAMVFSTPKGQLFEEVRSTMGATYDISARVAVGRVGSWWEIGGAFEPDKAAPAALAVLAAVRNAREKGVSAAELEGARTRFIASYRSSAGTTGGVTGILAGLLDRGLSPADALARPGRMAGLTSVDLQRAAQKWLSDSALRLVVVGPRKAIEGRFESLGIGAVEWRTRRAESAR